MQHRQELLYEKERRAHVDGKQLVEVLDGRLFDARGPGYAGIGDQDIEARADDFTSLGSESVRSVRGAQIRLHDIRLATALADARHNRLCLRLAAAVVHECPGARNAQGDGSGTPYSARGAGNERRFSNQSDISYR